MIKFFLILYILISTSVSFSYDSYDYLPFTLVKSAMVCGTSTTFSGAQKNLNMKLSGTNGSVHSRDYIFAESEEYERYGLKVKEVGISRDDVVDISSPILINEIDGSNGSNPKTICVMVRAK